MKIKLDQNALDLLIARAKNSGDQFWYHTKAVVFSIPDKDLNLAFNCFAGMCDAFGKEFDDPELGELLALEMFLRAGKRMLPEVKIANRKRADQLIELILRRK